MSVTFVAGDSEGGFTWKLTGNFTHDLLAGLFVACDIVISGLAVQQNTDEEFFYYHLIRNGKTTEFGAAADFDEHVIAEYDTASADAEYYSTPGTMGLWVYSSEYNGESYWDYVESKNMAEFLRGFITVFKSFGLDFRDYILSPPFDEFGTEYDIVSYNLEDYFKQELVNESDGEFSDEEKEFEEIKINKPIIEKWRKKNQ